MGSRQTGGTSGGIGWFVVAVAVAGCGAAAPAAGGSVAAEGPSSATAERVPQEGGPRREDPSQPEPLPRSPCEVAYDHTVRVATDWGIGLPPAREPFIRECHRRPDAWPGCIVDWNQRQSACAAFRSDTDNCVDPFADAYFTAEGNAPSISRVDLDGDGIDDFQSTSTCATRYDVCYSRLYLTEELPGGDTCTRFVGVTTLLEGRLSTSHHGVVDLRSCESYDDCGMSGTGDTVLEYDGHSYQRHPVTRPRLRVRPLEGTPARPAYACEEMWHALGAMRTSPNSVIPDRAAFAHYCEALPEEQRSCLHPRTHCVPFEPPAIAAPALDALLRADFSGADRRARLDLDGDGPDDVIIYAPNRFGGIYRNDDGSWTFLGIVHTGVDGPVIDATESNGMRDIGGGRLPPMDASSADTPQTCVEEGATFDGTRYVRRYRRCGCDAAAPCGPWEEEEAAQPN